MADAVGEEARVGRSLIAGAAGTVVLNASTLVLNFVITLVLARMLGAGEYGAYAFALAWATILVVPASLGLTPLVLRHIAAYRAHESWGLLRGVIRRTNQAVAASSAVVVALGGLVGWLLHDSNPTLFRPFLISLALVPLFALGSLRQAALQGLHRVVLGRVPGTLVLPGVFLVLVIVASVQLGDDFSAEWATGLNVAAGFAAFLVGAVLLGSLLPGQVRTAVPEYEGRTWLRGGIPLLELAVLLALNAQIGTILLATLDTADSAGTFSVALRIATFTSFFSLAATYPLYPNVARLWAIGEVQSIQIMLTRTSRIVLIASGCLAAVIVVFASQILELFGTEFADGANALRILTLGELVKVAAGFGGLALLMTPNESSMTQGIAVGVVVNVALAAALIPVLGVNGAAIAAAAGSLALSVCVTWLAWRRLGLYAPAVGRPRSRSPRE